MAKRYPHVTLVAEPDRGQSDALNKGFDRVSGDVIVWLNWDDVYADYTVFQRVGARFNQADNPDIVYGRGTYIDTDGTPLRSAYVNPDPATLHRRIHHEDGILQPALFMRRTVIERVGLLRTDRHYTMDYEYWIRCVELGLRFAYLDDELALARYHRSNKTFGQRAQSYAEICEVMRGTTSGMCTTRGSGGTPSSMSRATTASSRTPRGNARGRPTRWNASMRHCSPPTTAVMTRANLFRRLSDLPGPAETQVQLGRAGSEVLTPVSPCHSTWRRSPATSATRWGPWSWAFEAQWKQRQIEKSHWFLRNVITTRRLDVCVIAGNGPSLNRTDLSLLTGHDVIVSNNAFLSEELSEHAAYYTVVNYLVAEQSVPQINLLEHVHKVVPYWLSYCLNPGANTHFVDAVGHARFSTDMFRNMSWRHTVTFFNLHLAYGLGYRRVVLIGLDHSYQQAPGIVEQAIVRDEADDVNHFSPAYFRGKQWQAADVTMMEAMYAIAKGTYEADGREILNATVGGALELFPRVDLSHAFDEPVSRRRDGDSDSALPNRDAAHV